MKKSDKEIPVSRKSNQSEAAKDEPETDMFPRLCQYSSAGDRSWSAVGKTIEILPAGCYNISMDNNGNSIFQLIDLNVDDLLYFEDSQSKIILDEIRNFWDNGDNFKHHGFLHRRGYMLYGPPGGGKTCIVQQIIRGVIDHGGIVFICNNPNYMSEGIHTFRSVEPDRPVVCVFEDIDSIIDEWGDEEILAMLDGEAQIDKVLNIATTNYPESLDKRIVARPRRFDRVVLVKMPSENVRRDYFERKLNIKEDELQMWVDDTENFSFAAMAELVISVKCLGYDFDYAVGKVKELMEVEKSSNDYKESQGLGFGSGN